MGTVRNGQLMTWLSNLLDEKFSKLVSKDDQVNWSGNDLNGRKWSYEAANIVFKCPGKNYFEIQRNNTDCGQIFGIFFCEVLGCNLKMCVKRAYLLRREGKAIIAHFPDHRIHYVSGKET